MKTLPLFEITPEVWDKWLCQLEKEGLSLSRNKEASESMEAWHQTWEVERVGKVIFWFELAKEKPSGRQLVIFGQFKPDCMTIYLKSQEVLLAAGGRKLMELKSTQ